MVFYSRARVKKELLGVKSSSLVCVCVRRVKIKCYY